MIKIICVGKIKEKYLREAIEEYKKRLSKYTKLEIIEVSDIDNPSIDIILLKEKELIEKHIDIKDYVITLEIDGNMLNSIELANKIDNIFNTNSTITFIIGGSYGLHDSIKERSNYKLSFSKLTFPHQLFRINLLEQIYRSFKINNNEAYHK
jgi:23S rRNA (pseudouridine1915-N3)-methyltransferase